MAGEPDLRTLLRHMTPHLQPGTFMLCSFAGKHVPTGLAPIATFRESEGLTAIVKLDEAKCAGVPYQLESSLITL